jgi:hypothetical protein
MEDEKEKVEVGYTDKCQRCGAPVPPGLHPCPFAEEINNVFEDVCNCCKSCTHECAMDI